jgi:hypothetical protein
MWLALSRADALDEDQTVWINFDCVTEVEWIEKRRVTVLLFAPGYRTEVRESPELIFKALDRSTR